MLSILNQLVSMKTTLPLLVQRSSLIPLLDQQIRTTFILKRKWKPPLDKRGRSSRKLKSRHFIYELVEDTHQRKKEDISVILTQHVDGVGVRGDIVSVTPDYARSMLLLPKLAVYASPENLAKFEIERAASGKERCTSSSPTVQQIVQRLSTQVLAVIMNYHTPWTIEPWHIRMSFRKARFIVPEYAITLPSKPITGPDDSKEGRDFYVTVTINNFETVNVRCRIHHWGLENQVSPRHWQLPGEPVFPEDAEVLKCMPLYVQKESWKKYIQ